MGNPDTAIFRLAEREMRSLQPREWRRLWRRNARKARLRTSLARPVVANEKYLWRKVLDHDPRFVLCSDKLASKAWLASLGIGIPTPRTLWAGTDPAELPAWCVDPDVIIKVNHGTAMNLLVEGAGADRAALVSAAAAHLARNHGARKGEWAYAGVRRRVFAEERLFRGRELVDLKVYTFGPFVEQVVPIYRGATTTAALWDADEAGELRLSRRKTAVSPIVDRRPLPEIVREAIRAASVIGGYFDHIRVDFMTDGAALLLGELTVYNLAGRAHCVGHVADAPLNRRWDLRRSWFLNASQEGWRANYAEALRRHLDRKAETDRFLASVPAIAPGVFAIRYEDFAPE